MAPPPRLDIADPYPDHDQRCRTRFRQLAEPEQAKLAAALQGAEAGARDPRRQADKGRNSTRSHPSVTDGIRRIDHEFSRESPGTRAVDVPDISPVPVDRDLGIGL